MYYQIKVWSIEDNTQKKSFYYQDNDPLVNEKFIADECRKYVDYQVKVYAFTSKPRKCNKVLAWSGVIIALRKVKFYTTKTHEVEDWIGIATFYKEKPFDIEVSNYMGVDYTFFKRPGKYTISIVETLVDTIDPCSNILGTIRLSRYDDPFVIGKYAWSYDGFGHVCLNKLIGTHKEITKEQLYC